MGMKEEITSIARSLGYTGPTPASKTSAVHAVAEVAGSGGGGGEAGYDVTITKEWLVAEQSVTTARDEQSGSITGPVTLSRDLKDAYDSGMRAATLAVNGEPLNATFYMNDVDDDTTAYGLSTNDYDISALYDGETLLFAVFTDYSAEGPSTYTVSCYHETVSGTTTPEFDHAVAMAETAGKFVVTFKMSDDTCDRSFEEIAQAWTNGKPMACFMDDGGLLYAGEATQGVTDIPTFIFTRPETVMPDVAAACDRHFIMSAMIDEESGEPTGWQHTEACGNIVYVNNTLSGQDKWTLDLTPTQIYTVYSCGFAVAFGNQGDSQLPVFMENVTSLSKPMATVESFGFQRFATYSDTLEVKTYHVSTVGGIPTMTLTKTIYQLTPAS